MDKSNFYKKVIISVTGATLLSVGLNQTPNEFLSNVSIEANAATKKIQKAKKVGANSAVYKRKGKKMVKTRKTIKVGKKVRVSGQKTYKGKLYYKIGKNQYIKAVNVDGKTREVAKTTALYTRSGKAIKNTKVIKGQKIKIYGATVKIKGQKYFSTQNGYIKVSALAKKKQVVKPNDDNGDTQKPGNNNSGNNTPTNPSEGSNNSTTPTTPATPGGTNNPTTPSNPTNPTNPSTELQTAKNAAIKAIQDAAQSANSAIDASSLTASEKTDAKNKVDEAVKMAIGTDAKGGKISEAKTADEVTAAQTTAVTAIKKEEDKAKAKTQGLQTAKDNAIAAVKDAYEKAKATITASTLEDAEKTQALSNIEEAAKTALGNDLDGKSGAIFGAGSTDDVNAAKENALSKISAEVSGAAAKDLKTAKAAAKVEITNAETEAKEAIAATNLSPEEKKAANDKVDAAVKVALGDNKDGESGAIFDAKTTDEVNKAKTAAITKILAEENTAKEKSLQNKKDSAVLAINKAADDAKKVIDNTSGSPEDKTTAKTQVDTIVTTYLGQDKDGKSGTIHDAATEDKVAKAQTSATNEINLTGERLEAINLLTDSANAAKNAASGIENETDKAAAIAKIDQALADAKTAIANAKETKDITQAETDFQSKINDAVSIDKQKTVATSAVNKAKADVEDAISHSTLTEDEKTQLSSPFDALISSALGTTDGSISNAKTTDEIFAIQNSVDVISKLTVNKIKAIDEVNGVNDLANSAVGWMADGSDKTAAPEKVKAALAKAKTAILDANTQDEVNNAKTEFQTEINNIVPLDKQKIAARDKVKIAAKTAKTTIDNSTSTNKETLKQNVDTAEKAAADESGTIDTATTTADIIKAQNAALSAIKAIEKSVQ